MNAPPIQYVATAEGLNIAYSVTGSGRCVIYMGLPINHIQLAWHNEKDLLSALAMHWSLVQCDQRGQGLSSRAIPVCSIDDHVDDLRRVIDRVTADGIVLIASGFNVCVAVRFALAAPERVAALVLRDTTTNGRDAFSHNLRQLAEQDWETFLNVAASSIALWTDPPLTAADLRSSVSQRDWLNRVQTFSDYDLRHLLAKVSCPTLVVATTGATVDWVPEGKLIAALIPNAKLIIGQRRELRPQFGSLVNSFLEDTGFAKTLPPLYEDFAPLSLREAEVLRLLAVGRSNQQIADDLTISLNTVRRHVSNIFTKIGASNRVEAASYARRHGLIATQ
jgi:DNA-binding CsgD family transcriptional regulator/pimeloyl-ACP methyl ester carboxylesterase